MTTTVVGWLMWGCKSPCPEVNVPYYFTKMTFLSRNYPFIFQKYPFVSRKAFLFYKNALLFSRKAFFLFTVCFFFKECFFCSCLYLFLVLLKAAQRDKIYLALVLFLLGTLYWPTYDAFWIYMETFFVIYSKFSLHDNLGIAAFDHFKMAEISMFPGVLPPNPARGFTASPDPPAVLCTAYVKAKIWYP